MAGRKPADYLDPDDSKWGHPERVNPHGESWAYRMAHSGLRADDAIAGARAELKEIDRGVPNPWDVAIDRLRDELDIADRTERIEVKVEDLLDFVLTLAKEFNALYDQVQEVEHDPRSAKEIVRRVRDGVDALNQGMRDRRWGQLGDVMRTALAEQTPQARAYRRVERHRR
jgi:hypothetical protein